MSTGPRGGVCRPPAVPLAPLPGAFFSSQTVGFVQNVQTVETREGVESRGLLTGYAPSPGWEVTSRVHTGMRVSPGMGVALFSGWPPAAAGSELC